jgi:hypothetical protein
MDSGFYDAGTVSADANEFEWAAQYVRVVTLITFIGSPL